MKLSLPILSVFSLLAGASLLVSSCKTVTGQRPTTTFEGEPGVPGGRVVQTDELNATVTAIDQANRKVTLVTRAGEKVETTAGPEVINFPQIKVGDQLTVTHTEDITMRMAKPGEKIDEKFTFSGDAAKPGKRPGVSVSETLQSSATVADINERRRRVKLRFSDGSTETFPIRDDIDLSKHQVGEVVAIRSTESFTIKVSKP